VAEAEALSICWPKAVQVKDDKTQLDKRRDNIVDYVEGVVLSDICLKNNPGVGILRVQ
jgi:hypothetical protein